MNGIFKMKVNLIKVALSSTFLFTQSLFAFHPLEENEFPKGTFSVPFTTKMETDPQKIGQLTSQGLMQPNSIAGIAKFVELGTDIRDIEITFLPRGIFPTFIIPKGFPLDAQSHINAMVGVGKAKTDSRGFGYMDEDIFVQPNPQHVIGKFEYFMSLTPDQFMVSLRSHLGQVQQAGIKAVSLKNPDIMRTIDTILNGNFKQRQTITQVQFREVFALVSYIFDGKTPEGAIGLERSLIKDKITLESGSKPGVRVRNSRTVKAWLEKAGIGLSEDKTHLRMTPQNRAK